MDWLGFENQDDSAVEFFGVPVGAPIGGARRVLRYAERRLISFTHLADDPRTPGWQVEQELAEFLVWTAQLRVCLDAAIKASNDLGAVAWWRALLNDEQLIAFRDYRNGTLKRVESHASRARIDVDLDGQPGFVAFWAFTTGPEADQPVIPVCQKYLERLRDLLMETQTRLAGLAPEKAASTRASRGRSVAG